MVPLTGSALSGRGSKQRNNCRRQGLDGRESCTVDPDVFGEVLDVTLPCKWCAPLCEFRGTPMSGRACLLISNTDGYRFIRVGLIT